MRRWIKSILCVGILVSGIINVNTVNVEASESKNKKAVDQGNSLVHNADELEKIKANPEGFSTSDGKIHTDNEVREKKKQMLTGEIQQDDALQRKQNRKIRSIFGKDERKRIEKTTQSPYQSIVLLEYTSGPFYNKTKHTCTGAIIDDSTILTAAHCIYDKSKHAYVDGITVSAGYNNGEIPYGQIEATKLMVPNAYVNTEKVNQSIALDFGVVKVPKGTFTNHKFFKLINGISHGDPIIITGYPSDKEEDGGYFSDDRPTMWESRGTIDHIQDVNSIQNGNNYDYSILHHKLDTYKGMSGSPNYYLGEDGETMYLYGIFSSESSTSNYSCGITLTVIDNVNYMKQA
ncbi:serine protease [Bacillus sp. CDB3]|uniref:trypsin-like serine peptidase n=1 Tax=Bacillus sp. CDB3 TaxID=360310 RepID=UPI0009D89746|nr:trypsin-like serine protease [Bacillus sp. CDB3]OQR54845.1 hypothetical protein CDB3_21880 [Bacillus sp. CDB3]